MNVEIVNMVMGYVKNLDPEDARDILMVAVMPLVCVIIEDLIKEGKIKLC